MNMDMDVDIEELLKELGWSDGFHIPVANEENKALELEVQKKQKEKENLKSTLDDINDRLTSMKKHLINVEREQKENQNLLLAHHNQISAEENFVKLAQTEESSLCSDIRKMKKDCIDIQDHQNTVQVDINRILERLEKLKAVVKWDKEALLAWDEEVSRGDDDTIMLEKFTKEDEIKFKELELQRQTLRLEVEGKRRKLETSKNDLICMQQALEKTSQMFRRQHVDRKALVRQWEGSVRVLHQRDEDINRTLEEIGALRTLAKERLKDLDEQKTFYENEQANNKELEMQIEMINKESCELKEKIAYFDKILVEMNSNLLAMRTVLQNTTTCVQNQRSKNKQLTKDMATKAEQTEEIKAKVQEVKEECDKVKNKKMSAADRVQKLEEMFKNEEKILDRLIYDCKKLTELLFQVSEQLRELKDGEKQQHMNMESIESSEAVIRKELAKTESELKRQKEILYNMDFAYMEKEMQLNRMLGTVKEDDSEKYEKKIFELEEVHKKLSATNSLLTKEVSRLEEEMRRLTADIQIDSKELDSLKSKRQDNILLTEGGQKQLKAMRTKNQDKQVDENVLKLRVKQAEKAIDKVGGKVFSLEKQRLELEEAMREREIEISALRDILTVRRRVLNEQAANLSGRINLARLKVEQLKKKYDVAMGNLGTDEDGQQLSVTYFKIKTAQEKFELQEIGDKLDSKIRRTEKEITAMENTLKVVNATNRAFKNNLQTVEADGPEQAEKERLERSYIETMDELRMKKSILEGLNLTTMRMEEQYQEQLRVEEEILNAWKEKDQQATEIDKDLRDQEEKLSRAEKQLKKLIRDIRGTQNTKFQTMEEKDIELRELMDQNQSGLQQLAELVAKTIDTGPVVNRYLSEKGIALPSIKSPGGSIKYASSSSLLSPGRMSASSRTSDAGSSRTSSCPVTPSVVTLDSAKLDEGSDKKAAKSKTSVDGSERKVSDRSSKGSLKDMRKKSGDGDSFEKKKSK